MQDFLGKSSEVHGLDEFSFSRPAKSPDFEGEDGADINFEMESFIQEMQRALDLGDGDADSSDEGSSFYGDYPDDSEKGELLPPVYVLAGDLVMAGETVDVI